MRRPLALIFASIGWIGCNGSSDNEVFEGPGGSAATTTLPADPNDSSSSTTSTSELLSLSTSFDSTSGSASVTESTTEIPKQSIWSAFHGLDDSVTVPTSLCETGNGKDGLPIVVSGEIETIPTSDMFAVYINGKLDPVVPDCAILKPADDEDEDRTIALIGDFGVGRTEDASQTGYPERIEIVKDLLVEGTESADDRNLKGSTYEFTSSELFSNGSALVYAEPVTDDDGAAHCPEGTVQAIRIVFNGGVTKRVADVGPVQWQDSFGCSDQLASVPGYNNNEEPCICTDYESSDCSLFSLYIGSTEIHPFAFGDVFDGDNNLELCLDAAGIVDTVRVLDSVVFDPNHDPNAETEIDVTGVFKE